MVDLNEGIAPQANDGSSSFGVHGHDPRRWWRRISVRLRWLGVGYLLYLAYKIWTASGTVRLDGSYEKASRLKIYIQGALICLTNPKVMVFIAFVFPQTVNPSYALLPQLIVLGVTGAMLSFIAHGFYSILGHTLGQSVPSPRARRISNRVIAIVFIVAAFGLGISNIG